MMKKHNKAKSWIALCLILIMIATVIPMNSLQTQAATTDAFGMDVDSGMTDVEKAEALDNNPYGTRQWTTLVSGTELFMAKGYENTRKFETFNYNNGRSEGSIGDAVAGQYRIGYKEESNKGGFTLLDTAAVDVKGEGQKRYVATLGYWRAQRYFQLFLSDKDGNRVSSVAQIGNKDSLDYLEEVKSYYYTSFVSVAAGDFNGDGKDTVIVYYPAMETGDKPSILEYSVENFQMKHVRTVVGNLYSELGVPDLTQKRDKNDRVRRNTPHVQMTAGDLDRDGIDELIVTAGMNSTYDDVNDRDSHVFIYDYINKAGSWSRTHTTRTKNYKGGHQDDNRLRYSSSSIGNVVVNAGTVDFPEIVTAGWVDKHDGDGDKVSDRIGVVLTNCTGVTMNNGTPVGQYNSNNTQNLDVGEFTREGHYAGDDIQAVVPVVAFNPDGMDASGVDSVLVADTVYSYDTQGSAGSWKKVFRDKYFDDDDDGIGGYLITNNLVQDAVAGNFTCNTDGDEEVVFSICQKQNSVGNYFLSVYTYRKEKNGQWKCSQNRSVINHNGRPYLSLTAFDCDSDSILARVKDVVKTYTDPEVLTILESTPYFKEINEGDVGNSQTAYGQSEGSGNSTSSSKGVTTEAIVGFEWGVDDICAGFTCGAGFEATVENNFSWETAHSTSTTFELEYSNDSGENMVIVCRRPVWVYEYEVKNSDSNMFLTKQGKLMTNMVSVDTYNEAAAQYGLDEIPEGMLGDPGNPLSYRSGIGGLTDAWTSGHPEPYNGSGTVSQSLSEETEDESTYTYELNFSFQAYGIIFGAKVGGGAGYASSESKTTITTSGITKTGAVTCIGEEGYDFNWEFGHWKVDLNNTKIPVLGYLVTNVMAPPSPPVNLASKNITSDSALLTWEAGDRLAEGYRIYQIYQDGSSVQIAEVDGTETEYKLTHLLPDTAYTYAITGYAYGSTIKGESVMSEEHTLTTLPEGLGSVDIVSPKDVSARIGSDVTFTAGITVNSDYYKATNYQWQKRSKGGSWENIAKATSSRYSISGLSQEENNTEYRCIFKVSYTNATSLINYFSEAAVLSVGEVGVNPTLTIAGHDNSGKGTLEDPYHGYSDSLRMKEMDRQEVETEENVTLPAKESIPELTLYQKDAKELYGVGTDENGQSVYYHVASNAAGSYEVTGEEIKEEYVQTYLTFDKNEEDDSKLKEITGIDSSKYEQISKANGEKQYYLFAVVDGEKAGNDSLLTDKINSITYYWSDGAQYYAYGANGSIGAKVDASVVTDPYDVYSISTVESDVESGTESGSESATESNPESNPEAAPESKSVTETEVILGREETWYGATESEGTEHDYLQLKMDIVNTKITNTETQEESDETVYKTTYMKVKGGYAYNEDGFDPSELSLVTNTKKVVVETPIYETKAGTKLTFSTVVTEEVEGKAVNGLGLDFVVTNTKTNTTQMLSATTNKDGAASVTWTAPVTSLYKIEVVTRKQGSFQSATSDAQYYDAAQTYDKDQTEYQLILSGENGRLTGTTEYGDTINLQLQSRKVTVAKDGSNTYGSWEAVADEGITYAIKDSQIVIHNKTYKPEGAGALTFYAYTEGSSDIPVAEASLKINRKNILLTPVFEGTPASADVVTIQANDDYLNSLDATNPYYLKKIFDVKCGYFTNPASTGVFDVTLGYKKAEANNAVASFQNNYNVKFASERFTVYKASVNIEYSAGENGNISGKYSDHRYPFDSGSAKVAETLVEFDAVPNAGYSVGSWTINGKTYDVSKGLSAENSKALETLGIHISNANKKVTIDSLSTKHAVKNLLTVKVDFISITKTITYGVGNNVGGSIQAVEGSGHSINSNAKVEKGSDITFTASPDEGYIVDYWVINNKRYTWKDANETFSGTVVAMTEIQENISAIVYFKESSATYKVTTHVVDENEKTNASLATVTAANAENKKPYDSLSALPEKASITFTANVANPTNNMVKEWQTSTDGVHYTSIKGSGGQKKVTIYNLSADLYVRVVITAADYHKVAYEVHCGDKVITDKTIASIEAKCKADVIENESTVAALIPIDFTASISNDYLIDSWSSNVVTNQEDNHKASLEALTKDIVVVLNIVEKPKVTVKGAEGGIITVKGTYAGADKTFAVLENKKASDLVTAHLDPGTDVIVTWEPMKGYVVAEDAASEGAVYLDKDGKTTDDKIKTYENVTEDFQIAPAFAAMDQAQILYRTKINTGTQANGTVTASADRKGMEAYHADPLASEDKVYLTSDVTFKANPDPGYRVKEWSINGTILKKDGMRDIRKTITLHDISAEDLVDGQIVVMVSFEHIGQEITVESGEHGSIVSATAAGSDQMQNLNGGLFLTEGTKLALAVKADTGYEVDYWTVNEEKVEVDGNILKEETFEFVTGEDGAMIRVHFAPISYKVDFQGHNAVVGVDGVEGNETYVQGGKSILLIAQVNEGYDMDYWTINGEKVMVDGAEEGEKVVDTSASLTFTPAEGVESCDYTIEAYAKTKAVQVTYHNPENAIITAKVNGTALSSGSRVETDTEVTFTCTPDDNHLLSGWIVDGKAVESTENPYTIKVTKDVEVTAQLIPKQYTVSFHADGQGTVNELAEGSVKVDYDKEVTLTAAAKTYYKVDKWFIDGVEVTEALSKDGTSLTIPHVKADMDVVVTFAVGVRYPVTYEVECDDSIEFENVAAKRYGKVSGMIVDSSNHEEKLIEGQSTNGIGGSSVVMTAEPEEGFMIDYWEVNGEVQDSMLNTFTVESLTSKTIVKAHFTKLIAYQIPKTGDYREEDLLAENDVTYSLSDRTLDPELENVPEDMIRKDGSVTYLVKAVEGRRIKKISLVTGENAPVPGGPIDIKPLAVNEEGPAREENILTTENQADGSVLVTISNINADISLDVETVAIYTLTIKDPAYGKLRVKDASGKEVENGAVLDEGTVLTCKLSLPEGYAMEGWTGDLAIANADQDYSSADPAVATTFTATYTMKKDSSIGAKVVSLWRTVTILSSTKGKIEVKDASGKTLSSGTRVIKGTKLTCSATPAKYYFIKSWTGSLTGNAGTLEYTVENDTTIGASFEKLNSSGINAGISAKATQTKCTVRWGYVAGAEGYDIFVTRCGSKMRDNIVKTINNPNTLTVTFNKASGMSLSKIDCYKLCVKAFKMVGDKKKYLEGSYSFHIVNKKSKTYTNVKSVKLNKTAVTLKAKKTFKVKTKLVKVASSKKLLTNQHRILTAFYSSDNTVAKVDKNGKITAVAPGKCKIYVVTISGITKAINVTVK